MDDNRSVTEHADGTQQTLLTTKLRVPPVPSPPVSRPRLTERLTDGLRHKLTLVSAPAGYGKTTLLSEWTHQHERLTGWLSLDEDDNDVTRFWTYVIAALQVLHVNVGDSARTMLSAPQPAAIHAALTSLINDVAALEDPVVLILDDYHCIDVVSIHDSLTFLLDHLPRNMHLVIATRIDPPLPLARLRAHDQLMELDAKDLRFTREEIAAFFKQRLGRALFDEDLTVLERRTEGWVAGLQLASLSLQRHTEGDTVPVRRITEFLARLAGTDRYISAYLVEEVLRQQPKHVRTFFLQTSILDRLSASVCNAVTGRDDGQQTLERLEKANIFLTPLDNERRWYRYHQLFADLLRERVEEAFTAGQVFELHARAADWFARHDLLPEAIEHALAGTDFDRAARWIERILPTMIRRAKACVLLRWLRTLPDALVRSRAGLSLAYAWALLIKGELDSIAPRLRDAESNLPAAPPVGETGSKHRDTRDFVSTNHVLGQIAAIRAIQACYRGDVSRVIDLSNEALSYLPADASFLRAMIATNVALNVTGSYDSSAALQAANEALSTAVTVSRRAGNTHAVFFALGNLARVQMKQGHLHQATETCRQVIEREYLPAAGEAYVCRGELAYEWNNLDAALEFLNTGIERGRQWGNTGTVWAGYLALTRVHRAQGAIADAFAMVQEAERAARRSGADWRRTRAGAYRARLWLADDNVEAAARWARTSDLQVGDDIGHQRQAEYITLARVFLITGDVPQALELLTWLLEVTERTGLIRAVIKIQAVHALAHHAMGETQQALASIERAVSLAEPEGYVRIFVDEGPPMAELLRQLPVESDAVPVAYVRDLLDALGEHPPGMRALPEPLTDRELEVLRLWAAGLSAPEVADELVVAESTVRTHIKHVYKKLGVHNRLEAVKRAEELHVL